MPQSTIRVEVLQGKEQGKVYVAEGGGLTIGRAASNAVRLSDYHLSAEHAQIFLDGDRFVFRDLRSTNGSVIVRGAQRIVVDGSEGWEHALRDGDHVQLGDPTSPVILGCQLQVSETDDGSTRVLARRGLDEISALTDRVEADPADLATLYRALKSIGESGLELGSVLAGIATAVFDRLPRSTHLTILLADEDGDRFTPVLARSRSGSEDEDVKSSRTVLRRVLSERAAVMVADAPAELGGSESIMGAKIRSTIGVPLWHGDTIRGVIQVDTRTTPEMFNERDLEVLAVLASQASLAIENARLYQRLRAAGERMQEEVSFIKERTLKRSFTDIIGDSAAMRAIFEQLEKVIDTRATIHIEGETGTGKELVASAIHYQGRRREKLFVPFNCAALPENLVESELYGHKKGAFTGADRDKKGLFLVADGGTLFLDEIAELSLAHQAKLLRVLQEGEFYPVGSTKSVIVDVRVISATNKRLEKEVETGNFRQDLYYRLHVFPIRLPPLRERREDIPLLARHFLAKYTAEIRKDVAGLSQEALDQLVTYSWPGNVRELENELQRLVINCDPGGFVQPEHLSPPMRQVEGLIGRVGPRRGTLKEMMEQVERYLLRDSLREHGGNKTKAAGSLGITREGLHKKLAKYGMN